MSKVWLNLADIVASPEFTQQIIIKRHFNGRYVNGRFEQDEKEIKINAVVSASDEKTLSMVPEGDRNETIKSVHSLEKIYMTSSEVSKGENRTSDIIIYNGDEYKVIAVMDADDYGFTKAVISKIGAS
jgi:ATP-dependent Clp protease adapter protein ClpS